MFEETLEFKNAIIICYGRHVFAALHQRVPKAQVWVIVEVITSTLNLVVFAYVMNQNRGHWLLLDALTKTITLTMELEIQLLELSVGLKYLICLKQ